MTTKENYYRLIQGDSFKVLPTLQVGIIDLVVTDPPISDCQYYDKLLDEIFRIATQKLSFWTTISYPQFETDYPTMRSCLSKRFHYVELLQLKEGTKTNQLMCGSNTSIPLSSEDLKEFDAYVPATERLHSAQRPVPLFEKLIESSSSKNDTVLDPFLGSGTTMRASKNLERNCIGIEIHPSFCDIAKTYCSSFPNFSFQVFK